MGVWRMGKGWENWEWEYVNEEFEEWGMRYWKNGSTGNEGFGEWKYGRMGVWRWFILCKGEVASLSHILSPEDEGTGKTNVSRYKTD